jgi:hypothetical protein
MCGCFYIRATTKRNHQKPIKLQITMTKIYVSGKNRTNRTAPPTCLITLPEDRYVLPLKTPVRMTQTLWDSLVGHHRGTRRDELLGDISAYLAFAILGFVGFDHERIENAESVMFPVAFASGTSVMRLICQRQSCGGDELILSLPGEQIVR